MDDREIIDRLLEALGHGDGSAWAHIRQQDPELYAALQSYLEFWPSDDDGLSDVEADAMTLASAGMGTDEDYGRFGGRRVVKTLLAALAALWVTACASQPSQPQQPMPPAVEREIQNQSMYAMRRAMREAQNAVWRAVRGN